VQVQDTVIPEVKIVIPKVHGDARGFFSEVYNARDLDQADIELEFVQDNHSFSAPVGVLRGLHFQTPPFAQDKLVRVLRGRVYDVAVDLRSQSPTFGQHVAVELSRENWKQILVPVGFAHGFITLEPDTEVIYKVTNHYSREHDRGIDFADPELAIEWPLPVEQITLSDKDCVQPSLAEFRETNPF